MNIRNPLKLIPGLVGALVAGHEVGRTVARAYHPPVLPPHDPWRRKTLKGYQKENRRKGNRWAGR